MPEINQQLTYVNRLGQHQWVSHHWYLQPRDQSHIKASDPAQLGPINKTLGTYRLMKLCQSRQSTSTCSRAHLLFQKLNPLIITSNSTYIHASTINLYMYRVHHVYTHGTISTTLLSNTQSTYWVPKLKTEGQFECAQVLYKCTCSKPLC